MKEALFWVRIHDLPVMVRNANVGRTVGSALGRVIEVDLENDDLAEGEYMRVRFVWIFPNRFLEARRSV